MFYIIFYWKWCIICYSSTHCVNLIDIAMLNYSIRFLLLWKSTELDFYGHILANFLKQFYTCVCIYIVCIIEYFIWILKWSYFKIQLDLEPAVIGTMKSILRACVVSSLKALRHKPNLNYSWLYTILGSVCLTTF